MDYNPILGFVGFHSWVWNVPIDFAFSNGFGPFFRGCCHANHSSPELGDVVNRWFSVNVCASNCLLKGFDDGFRGGLLDRVL